MAHDFGSVCAHLGTVLRGCDGAYGSPVLRRKGIANSSGNEIKRGPEGGPEVRLGRS